MNDEQVLKDFIATAQANNYNYDVVMPKFPELEGYDLQVLKDYIATAEANEYDYGVVNPKFPELFGDKKKDDTESVSEDGSLEPPVAEEAPVVEETVAVQEEQPRTEQDQFFDMALEAVTPELIDRPDDRDTAMELNKLLNPYGFTFETTPFDFHDKVNVKAANGQEISINLDPVLDIGRDDEAVKLRNFLTENRKESENIARQADDYQEAKLQFANQKQIDENVAQLNQEANEFQQFQREVESAALEIQEKHAGLDKYTEEYLRANPEEYDEYKARYDAYAADMEGLQNLDQELQRRSQELLYADQEIKRAAGEFVEVQGGISTNLGLVKRALATGAGRIARGTVDLLVDIGTPGRRIDMFSERDTDSYKEQFIETARNMGVVGIPEEGAMDWVDGVGDALRNDVEVKMLDDYSKAIKFGGEDLEKMVGFTPEQKEFIGEKGLGQQAFDGMMWAFGELERDPTAFELAKEDWWGGAILGAFESVPAFIGLGKSALGKIMGAGTRLGRLYTQTSDHVDEEFRKDPELREVSETDKLKLKAPLALTVAALENIGFRNIVETRNVAGTILLRAMRKPTERAAGRTLAEVIARDVNNAVARGALTAASGAVSEFETGFLQEGADIGMKALWNAASENPDLNRTEGAGNILMAMLNGGAQEAVGSFVLGAPTAIGAAANKSDFSKLSNAELAVFEWMSNPGNRGATKPMIAAHLKNLVNQGKLTGAEAKAALDGYERTSQAMDGIRDVDGMTPKQKKEYLAMELRKQELQRQLDGRAAPFKKAIQQEIDDLNIRQQEIADAVQEQSTEKVPSRDETETGPEVGGKVQDDEKAPEKKGVVERMRDRLKQRRVRKSKAEYDKALARVAELEEQGATEEELNRAKSDADRARFDYLRNTLTEEQAAQESELDNERERLWEEYQKALGTEQEAEAEAAWFESTKKLDAFFDGVDSGITQEAAPVEETAPEVEVAPEEEVAPTEEAAPEAEATPELTEEERAEAEALEAQFGAEGTPDVTETTDDGVGVRTREGRKLTKKQQRYVEQANNVLKALRSVIPDIKVVAYQTTEQYREATGRRGSGVYIGKTIHINLAKANSRTAFHEAFHAIFLEQIKKGDPEAQVKAKVLLRTIRKAIPPKSVLANRIDNFLTKYEEQDISEEALSEVFGYIAGGYSALGPQAKSKIKAAVKKLIEGVIGRKLGPQWSQGDQAVLDAMQLLAGKVERGEAITEEELGGIEVSEEAAKKEEAEAEVDRGIGAIQKLRKEALKAANDVLGPLAEKVTKTDKGRETLRKLVKRVDDKKLKVIEKKMRDVKKSTKMSEADKAERIASLQRDAEAEMERLAKEREAIGKDIEDALKKLAPIEEKQDKESKLADIKKQQKEITEQLAKDKKEAKRVFEGEEQKEYIADLVEEADAKRAALRDEIAELRGEKKKAEPTVEAETAPVEEAVEEEAVEEEAATPEEELEKELEPTVATIRTKIGVEAFGKLEAAMRKAEEYYSQVADIVLTEDGKTQNPSDAAKYAALSRKENAVSKLADELGLTDAERAVMRNSVREKIDAEKRAAEAKEAEQAELKAAAERAKQAAEEKEAEPTVDDAEVARLEEELRQAEEDLDFYNRDEPDKTKYPKYKSFKELAAAVNAGKDPRFDEAYVPTLPELGTESGFGYVVYMKLGFQAPIGNGTIIEESAKDTVNEANGTRRATKSTDTSGVGSALEDAVRQLKSDLAEAKAKKAPVDDVAKRAAAEGISVEEAPKATEAQRRAALDDITVEEAEKRMAREAAERKQNLARAEMRKLAALKGKKDKASVAERKNIKQYLNDLKTMSVEEADAKRTEGKPKAREQRVVYHVTPKRNKRGIQSKGIEKGRKAMWSRGVATLAGQKRDGFDTANRSFVFSDLNDALQWAIKTRIEKETEVSVVAVNAEGKNLQEDTAVTQDPFGGLSSALYTEDVIAADDILGVQDVTIKNFGKTYDESGNIFTEDSFGFGPKAREQRVADVVERYEFRPNGSLKESSLAGELRRNLKRYGFGVKQFGTRMDEFHIVNLETGRKVDPKKLIAKDRADEKVEMEQRAQVREREAKESMARAEAEEAVQQELQQYQDEYQDFPEDMIPPSKLSAREQRSDLGDSTEGFSTSAVVKFAKERGYSDKVILAVRPGAEQAIAEYDAKAARVNREIQGIIQRTRERVRGEASIQAITNKGARAKAVNDRIEEAVLEYLRGSKFYKDASDVGREAMERAVKKQMGRRIKAAPSVIKLGIDGGIPTVDKKALADQIRAMARSSRATAAASREIMREVGKDIAKLKASGALTPAQATAIIKKMAAMNPFNPVQVDNFVNYVANVFADADYAQEVNRLNRSRKRALKNAETKLGVATDIVPMLRTLLDINAEAIPQEVFEKYTALVNMLAERKAVLDLADRTMVSDVTAEIMEAVDQELSMKEELLARYENYPKKESFAKTVKAMIEAEVLTKDEAKLLKKYASELREAEKMTEEEKQARRDEERDRLLTSIEALSPASRRFPMREENTLVRKFNELVKSEAIASLSNADLKNVLRVADNIENGFLPHNAQVLVEQMTAINRAAIAEQALKEARLPRFSRLRALFGETSTVEGLVRRNPLRFIGQIMGDYTTDRIYNTYFKDLAQANAQYKADLLDIQERLDEVEAKLIKSLGRNPNKVTRAKFLIGAYMMQMEFEANPGVSGVFSAEALLDETIKKARTGTGGVYYNDATADVLQSIRDQIDGKSVEQIEKLLSPEMKAVAKEIRKVNNELTPKAAYVAGVLRGVPFRPFSQYFHRVVLKPEEATGLRGVQSLIDQAKRNMRPSTRAKNLEQRTAESPPPVSFDPFASAKRGAKYILTDYHFTEPVRTNSRMLNRLDDTSMTGLAAKFRKALKGASNDTITDVLVQAYTTSSLAEKALEWAKRQGYRVVLPDVGRVVGEYLSNVMFAMSSPRAFFDGMAKYGKIAATRGSDVLRNVNSVQTTRIFPKEDAMSSRMVDSLRETTGPVKSDVSNAVLNKLKQIWSYTGGYGQAKVGQLADKMITTPDKMVTRPVWFGTFANEFKARTGQEVDFDKIAANDEAYLEEFREAIEAARDEADTVSVRTGATDNTFLGIIGGLRSPNNSPFKNFYRLINSYMTRFLVFEYVTARTAINAAVGNGTMSRKQGIALLGATTARMVMYGMITATLRTLIDRAFGFDEDEDEEDKTLLKSVVGGLSSLVLGRAYGSLVRGLASTGVELVNKHYLEEEGFEYDYSDQLVYPLIDVGEGSTPYKKMTTTAGRVAGPYGPPVKTLVLGGKLVFDSEKVKPEAIQRRKDEMKRFGLEVLGMAGMIPFYKDVRRLFMRKIYDDLDKEKKTQLPGTPRAR